MKYYILMEEWNYPNESGRNFIETFNYLSNAVCAASILVDEEIDNFSKVINEKEYPKGIYFEDNKCNKGFILNSKNKEIFYRAVIIEREV